MGKGIGLIGNFRGKVGNMVGYNLKDSNNKQTQGVRVYQPVVKNPKTYAQAEQRAKLAPINATYRALKSIIDRGQESKAYGNKSRLAWLKNAIKNYDGMWYDKGAVVEHVVLCEITHGTLAPVLNFTSGAGTVALSVNGFTPGENPTIGDVSTAILAAYPALKNGDQITFVACGPVQGLASAEFDSIVLDTESTEPLGERFDTDANKLEYSPRKVDCAAIAVMYSRMGANGEHLRSTVKLKAKSEYPSDDTWEAAKESAIKSYMAGGSTSDWPEEQIQG